MGIKKAIKRMGRCFVSLRQEGEEIVSQSVLIVDNGYNWLGYVNSLIEKVKGYFPKGEISVLTSPERRHDLQRDFPKVNFILPSERLRPRRYQIALEMLRMRKKRYDFIALLSLDITPLIIALFFFRSKVVLYNQWGQWWSIKLRNVSEIFKFTYIRKKTRFNLKGLLKKIGLFFVLLQHNDEEMLRHSVLILDSTYASLGHVSDTVVHIKDSLPRARISVLTTEQRTGLKNNFSDLEIIQIDRCLIKGCAIMRYIFRLRKNRYDYVILLSLDIIPIASSMLFMKRRLILFNRWHQWWSLGSVSIRRYLMVIPMFIFNIIIFIYLLFSVSWIFLKRSFNVFRFRSLGRKA